MKQFFVDLETTGLNPKTDKVIQLAGILKINNKIVKRVNFKENIQRETVAFLDHFIDPFNKSDKAYMLAWNARFESDFLHNFFQQTQRNYGNYFHHMPVDVQQLCAYRLMQKGSIPENFKLGTIAKHFNIPCNDDKLHDAAYDIDITNKIWIKIK